MTSVKFKFETWKYYVNKIGEMLLNDYNLYLRISEKKMKPIMKNLNKFMRKILSNIEQMKDSLFLLLEKLVLENQLF